ncbi:MAG: glycosyltransferase family 4 protein [Planctomycetes bacterium]|nr:glycosyltransferase family 4 protein [Planctomycetota bacterium]
MKRLRIGFDVTSAVKRDGRGIAAYIRALLPELAAAEPGIEPQLYIRDSRWFQKRLVRELLPSAPRRWQAGPFQPRGLDAYFGLGVRLPARCAAPRIFTLHDLRVYDLPAAEDPRWVRIRTRRTAETVARADGILCLSEHGRQRLQHHFPEFPLEATAVVPHGVDHRRFQPVAAETAAPVLARHSIDRPFLLQVGQLAPHKNPRLSLEAFADSHAAAGGILLVFAGGAVPGCREDLERRARELGVGDRLRWLDQVAFDELPALYSSAEVVLFPSHYEGFGLPLLEAMACGAPGVVSNATCLPEVNGGAWPLVDPYDPADLARHLDRFLIDPHFRRETVSAGRFRADTFTWAACARQTLDFLLQRLRARAERR